MSHEERAIRTGFGVLTESAPPPPAFDEIAEHRDRSPKRRVFRAAAVVVLALLVVVATTVLDGGMRLAYAMDPGLELGYLVNSDTTIGGATFASGPAYVGYRVSDAGNGLVDVEISYRPLDGCEECFPAATFNHIVTEQGEIVSIRGLADGSGIPEFVIPTPIPHAGISGGFPLFLGPPLPEHEIELGDAWQTSQDGVVGQHRLVDETQLGDRNVVIIESSYTFMQPQIGEQITAATTVWFDPETGVVLQARITRNQPWLDKTIETEFQLDG